MYSLSKFLPLLFLFNPFQQKTPLPDTLIEQIETNYRSEGLVLDISTMIDHFSIQLVRHGILSQSDLISPNSIYDKLEANKEKIGPEELGIKAVIPIQPLNKFLDNLDILNISDKALSSIALFTYYQSYSDKYRGFNLVINENRTVSFNQTDLPISSFESILFEEIHLRKNRNVTTANARFIIKADPYTQIEFVNFIMSKVKLMGISTVTFKRLGER